MQQARTTHLLILATGSSGRFGEEYAPSENNQPNQRHHKNICSASYLLFSKKKKKKEIKYSMGNISSVSPKIKLDFISLLIMSSEERGLIDDILNKR